MPLPASREKMRTAAPTTKRKIEPPLVTEKTLSAAQANLSEVEELKRQRAMCTHYLKSIGMDKEYSSWPIPERNHFLERWSAERIMNGKDKLLRSSRRVATNTFGKDKFDWMCKKEMLDAWGPEKTAGKIATLEEKKIGRDGKPLHRPDRDSGLDTEMCREYKIWHDTGGLEENDTNAAELEGESKLENAAELLEYQTQLKDMAANFGYSTTPIPVEVKQEPGTSSASSGSTDVFGGGSRTKDQELADQLATDSKRVLSNAQDVLMSAKEIFADTKPSEEDDKEFLAVVHQKMTDIIPKLSAMTKKVEKLHLSKITDPPTLLALAYIINDMFMKFNNAAEWYEKAVPGGVKGRSNTKRNKSAA
jgi:hypothetical protein